MEERSQLQQQIDALEAKRTALTGPENKNKRKKIATKLKKLTESLAALSIAENADASDTSGPALPASSASGGSATSPTCPKGHLMTSSDFAEGDYKTGWHCDVCGKFGAARTERWFCKTCPFDLCKNCTGASPQDVEDAEDDGNSDDERPDLLRQIAALEAKLASGDVVKEGERAAAEAEIASLRETVQDLDKWVPLLLPNQQQTSLAPIVLALSHSFLLWCVPRLLIYAACFGVVGPVCVCPLQV